MSKENDWQFRFIKRVRENGGYGRKWSSSFQVGPPDLIIAFPTLGVFTLECKLEESWSKNTQRTIGATEKQIEEMQKINAAGGLAHLLVFFRTNKTGAMFLRTIPVPPGRDREFLRVYRDDLYDACYDWRNTGGFQDWLDNAIDHLYSHTREIYT